MHGFKAAILFLLLSFSLRGFSQEKETKEEKPEVTIGGALRFNYNLSTWKEGQKDRYGDFGFDIFRINAKAKYKGVKLDAEYRLYSQAFGGGMLKQGWIQYDFNEKENIQIGLTQVPFGITQYNSNNWFFSLDYYVGLEDDHDMGIKFSHEDSKWEYNLAFFKNAEELRFGSFSDVSDSRYSYDVASIDVDADDVLEYRNKEVNQINGKINRIFGDTTITHKLGISAQYGGLYNLDTEEYGNHYALAVHYQVEWSQFKFEAQIANYKYNPNHPSGQSDEVIAMTAYGAPYLIASEAFVYTLGMSYDIPVDWGPISNIEIYNDFGVMDKAVSGFEESFMNVTGMLVTAGQVYTYIDFAAGDNQPFLGPDYTNSLAAGTPNQGWEMRFNVNLGYYF